MLNVDGHPNCFEFDVVEKAIKVSVTLIAGGESRIRIEALRDVHTGNYSTSSYVQRSFKLTASDDEGGQEAEMTIWVDYELPWTNAKTADDALNSVLAWLRGKCTT